MTEPDETIIDKVLTGYLTLTDGIAQNYGVSDYKYVGVKEFHEFQIRLMQKLLDRLHGKQ